MPKPLKVRLTKIEFPDSLWEKPFLGQVGELVKVDPPVLFDHIVHIKFPDELWNRAFKGTIPPKPFTTISSWIEVLPGERSIYDFVDEQSKEYWAERDRERLQRAAKRGLTPKVLYELPFDEIRILIENAEAWAISKEMVEVLMEYLPKELDGKKRRAYSKAHEHFLAASGITDEEPGGPGR